MLSLIFAVGVSAGLIGQSWEPAYSAASMVSTGALQQPSFVSQASFVQTSFVQQASFVQQPSFAYSGSSNLA